MRTPALLLAMGLSLGSLATACRPAPTRPQRVVVLGFDGADPEALQALVAKGELPRLAELQARGAYGPLRTFPPVKSAVLWTSIATGKSMQKHGIVDWAYLDRSGQRVPFAGSERRAATYWEILDAAGVSTGTLGWWLTSPPPALRHGFLVSDRYVASPGPAQVSPSDLHAWLSERLPRPRDVKREWQRLGLLDFRPEGARVPLTSMARSTLGAYRGFLLGDLAIDRLSDALRERRPAQVFSTYFRVVDVTSHFALHFAAPAAVEAAFAAQKEGQLDPEGERRLTAAVAEAALPAYRLMDEIVGKYVDSLDPGTLLVICSDHGFGWHDGAFTHYHRAQEPPSGVVLLAGPGVRPGYRLQGATVFDIGPTVLHALGQPVGEDMDGRPLERAFEPEWRARFPVRSVATHERGGVRPAAPRDRELDEKMLEDLRSLGYVDAQGKSKEED